jgi:hypothetical protein
MPDVILYYYTTRRIQNCFMYRNSNGPISILIGWSRNPRKKERRMDPYAACCGPPAGGTGNRALNQDRTAAPAVHCCALQPGSSAHPLLLRWQPAAHGRLLPGSEKRRETTARRKNTVYLLRIYSYQCGRAMAWADRWID